MTGVSDENLDKARAAGKRLLGDAGRCPVCDGEGEVRGEDGMVPCTAEDCRARRKIYGA